MLNILIIDDVYSELIAVQEKFQLYGNCSIAQNKNAAMQLFHKAYIENDFFDLIILDLEMPRASGIVVLEEISKDEELLFTPKAKKVMLANKRSRPETIQAAKRLSDGVIMKPLDEKYVRRVMLELGFIKS
jgi:DNA-binding NarL/FixJ family response regulator